LLGCDGTPVHHRPHTPYTKVHPYTIRDTDTGTGVSVIPQEHPCMYIARAYIFGYGFGWFGNNETEITEIK